MRRSVYLGLYKQGFIIMENQLIPAVNTRRLALRNEI